MVFGRGADSSDALHRLDAQRSAEIVLDLMREDEIHYYVVCDVVVSSRSWGAAER